jgi:hypothetical protein
MMLQHGFRGFKDGGVRRDRDNGPGHDLMGAHVTFSCSMYQEMAKRRGLARRCRRRHVRESSLGLD